MAEVNIEDTIVSILTELKRALPSCKDAVYVNDVSTPAFTLGLHRLTVLKDVLDGSNMNYPDPIGKYLIKLRNGLSFGHGISKSIIRVTEYISILIKEIQLYVDQVVFKKTVNLYA